VTQVLSSRAPPWEQSGLTGPGSWEPIRNHRKRAPAHTSLCSVGELLSFTIARKPTAPTSASGVFCEKMNRRHLRSSQGRGIQRIESSFVADPNALVRWPRGVVICDRTAGTRFRNGKYGLDNSLQARLTRPIGSLVWLWPPGKFLGGPPRNCTPFDARVDYKHGARSRIFLGSDFSFLSFSRKSLPWTVGKNTPAE